MSIPKPPGPAPAAKRRRRNTPTSYGLAEPTNGGTAGKQPELGFEAHFLVADMWAALGISVESRFFSAADWERARCELFYANRTLSSPKISAIAWAAVQKGLSELLVSPADKRRAGIELKAAAGDADEAAAVSQMASYREQLAG